MSPMMTTDRSEPTKETPMTDDLRPRRSVLYMPAANDRALEKAQTLPADAIIFGLKELPDDGTPLPHRHIMFGHAFKGQHSGKELLRRFREGGGTLYDLEYLVDETGRRVAAFGYWAGYAGAAVTLKAWAAQQRGEVCGPVGVYKNKDALLSDLGEELDASRADRPTAIVIGALGRVGTGAADLCEAMGVTVTKWDMKETASGGPFRTWSAECLHDVTSLGG